MKKRKTSHLNNEIFEMQSELIRITGTSSEVEKTINFLCKKS